MSVSLMKGNVREGHVSKHRELMDPEMPQLCLHIVLEKQTKYGISLHNRVTVCIPIGALIYNNCVWPGSEFTV